MAAQGGALPKISQQIHVDNAGKWFWNQLKKELAPYPGRAWVVGRVTIASTIVMLLVMTFRLPGGFLGAIFTFFLSRENPMATFRAGSRTVLAFLVGTAYTIITVSMLIADPLTHFLWVPLSLFIAFYLMRVMLDYGTAVAYGFMVAGAPKAPFGVGLFLVSRFSVAAWRASMLWIDSAAARTSLLLIKGAWPR